MSLRIIPIQMPLNYFFHCLILYAIAVIYWLPYELELPYAKIGLPILTVILGVQILLQRRQLEILDLIAVGLVIVASLFNPTSYHLMRYSLPICLLCIGFSGCQPIRISRTYLMGLCWLSIVTMIYQLAVYRRIEFDGTARISLSNGDPNVSGLFMLLFLFLSIKARFTPGIILAVISSVLFLSRNYFLAIIIFFGIIFLEPLIIKLFSRISFLLTFIVVNFIGIMIGEIFLQFVQIGFGYDTGTHRLFSINDASNLIRFEANRFLWQSYLANWQLALGGYGANYETVFRPIGAIIHNSLLEVIAYTGIPLGLAYFFVLIRLMGGYYTPTNIKYILTYLFFGLFLHSSYQGLSPFLFVSILALSVEKGEPQEYLYLSNIPLQHQVSQISIKSKTIVFPKK